MAEKRPEVFVVIAPADKHCARFDTAVRLARCIANPKRTHRVLLVRPYEDEHARVAPRFLPQGMEEVYADSCDKGATARKAVDEVQRLCSEGKRVALVDLTKNVQTDEVVRQLVPYKADVMILTVLDDHRLPRRAGRFANVYCLVPFGYAFLAYVRHLLVYRRLPTRRVGTYPRWVVRKKQGFGRFATAFTPFLEAFKQT